MGGGNHRPFSDHGSWFYPVCFEAAEMETRARRDMDLGGNIGQRRQLANRACLRPKVCQAVVSRTNTTGRIVVVQTIVRGGTPDTHGNQHSARRVTLLPRRLWAVLSNTWRERERGRFSKRRVSHDLHGSMMISSSAGEVEERARTGNGRVQIRSGNQTTAERYVTILDGSWRKGDRWAGRSAL